MEKYPYPRWTTIWWLDLMMWLRKKKEYEFSDGIREMLENKGLKIEIGKNNVFIKGKLLS